MSADYVRAIDFHPNEQRGDGLFLIEPARTPAQFRIFRAFDGLPAGIAIRRGEHNASLTPGHFSLAIAYANDIGVFMHMEKQLNFVPSGASKAIFDGDIPGRTIKPDSTTVAHGVRQMQVTIVFRLDRYLSGAVFEPQQPGVCLGTP